MRYTVPSIGSGVCRTNELPSRVVQSCDAILRDNHERVGLGVEVGAVLVMVVASGAVGRGAWGRGQGGGQGLAGRRTLEHGGPGGADLLVTQVLGQPAQLRTHHCRVGDSSGCRQVSLLLMPENNEQTYFGTLLKRSLQISKQGISRQLSII